jgi:hypothetical protein
MPNRPLERGFDGPKKSDESQNEKIGENPPKSKLLQEGFEPGLLSLPRVDG